MFTNSNQLYQYVNIYYCKDNVYVSGYQHPLSGLLKCITSATGTGRAAKHKGLQE